MREYQTPDGILTIIIRDPSTGAVVLERRVKNLVTLAGRTLLAELLIGTVDGFDSIALAVGGPSADPGYQQQPVTLEDTALQNQLESVAVSFGVPTPMQDKATEGQPLRVFTQISGTLEADDNGESLAMNEAGIIITKRDGTEVLYNRVTFEPITKAPGMQMTLIWEVIF